MNDTTKPAAALPGFIRKGLERAIEAAKNPQGMGVHDGMIRVHASHVARLLIAYDAAASKTAEAPDAWREEMQKVADELEGACGGYSGDFPDTIEGLAQDLRNIAAAPQAEAQIKTDGCAGFQGLPVSACGPCESKGCDSPGSHIQPSIEKDDEFEKLISALESTATDAQICGGDHGTGRKAITAYDALVKFFDAKLDQAARDKDGNHVDDLRAWLDEAREQYEVQDVSFHATSLKLKQAEIDRDEWKAKFAATEEKLASIRAALDKE